MRGEIDGMHRRWKGGNLKERGRRGGGGDGSGYRITVCIYIFLQGLAGNKKKQGGGGWLEYLKLRTAIHGQRLK